MLKYVLLATLITAAVTQATLVLNVDMNAKELWFSGSDSGASNDNRFGSSVGYSLGADSAGTDGSSDVIIDSCFDNSLSYGFLRAFYGTAGTGLHISLSSDSPFSAIIANETHIDYSAITRIDSFESVITEFEGSSMPLSEGTDFSPVEINVVPEPATMALLGLGGLMIRCRKA